MKIYKLYACFLEQSLCQGKDLWRQPSATFNLFLIILLMERIVNWLLIRCWICFIIFLLMERTIQFEAPTLIIPAHGHLVQNPPRTKNTKLKWNKNIKTLHSMENPSRTKKIQNGLKGNTKTIEFLGENICGHVHVEATS